MVHRPGLRRERGRGRKLTLLLVLLLFAGSVVLWLAWVYSPALSTFTDLFTSGQHLAKNGGVGRGTLYDRNYKELAVSLERVSVFVRTRELGPVAETAARLADILDEDNEAIVEKLQVNERRTWLKRNISQEQEDALRSAGLPGVHLHRESSRFYPHNTIAAPLLGFVEDDLGLAGVEYYYDRLQRRLLQEKGEKGSTANHHLLLTIDLKIQKIFEGLVKDLSEGRSGVKIGAFALDASSGALVAAAQHPSFNANTYRIYSEETLDNLLVRPMLLPVAVRQLLRQAAAIQSQYESRGRVLPWSLAGQATDLGGELRLWDGLGFNREINKEFGAESSRGGKGQRFYFGLQRPEQNLGTVPETLSPLHLLAGLAILFNGGRDIEPHVVEMAVDSVTGKEVALPDDTRRKTGEQLVEPAVSRELGLLAATMTKETELGGGTLYDTIVAPYRHGAGFGQASNTVLLSLIPLQQSQLVVLVTIQDGSPTVQPKDGAEAVDPLSSLHAVMSRVTVLQQVGKSIAEVAEPEQRQDGNYPVELDALRQRVQSSLQESESAEPATGQMPELVGLSLRKGLRLLQGKPCAVRISGTGRIVAQQPAAGEPLAGVAECTLQLQDQEEVSLKTLEEQLSTR